MNILVINGSPRKNGNTEIMADVFIDTVQKNGHSAEKINLSETKVNPCIGCNYCKTHDGDCVQKDGMTDIYTAMDHADMVVFASPIYAFGLSAQMVALLDRFYSRIHTPGLHPKFSALLVDSGAPTVIPPEVSAKFKEAASETQVPFAFSAAVDQYKKVSLVGGLADKGFVAIGGMREKGDMKDYPDLQKIKDFALSL